MLLTNARRCRHSIELESHASIDERGGSIRSVLPWVKMDTSLGQFDQDKLVREVMQREREQLVTMNRRRIPFIFRIENR